MLLNQPNQPQQPKNPINQNLQQNGTLITCPNCRQPFQTVLEQIVDVGRDPSGKARLLSGQLNMVTCPHCNYQTMLATPLIYHDNSKELLLVYVPMELGLPPNEQNRLIGNMSNSIINNLPQEQRKGYLLNPKTMFTLQGMVETILEADGITKEVIEAQRAKMRLVEQFVQADPNNMDQLIKDHDHEIDNEFFAILGASAEAALASGRRDMAERMLHLREALLESTTAGQELIRRASAQEEAIQGVADELNALGENASYDNLVDLALKLAVESGDEKLQVLVGLARPALDYEFFQTFTARIDRTNGEDKQFMSEVREKLLELISVVDQQQEQAIRAATDTLRGILGGVDIDAAIRARLEMLDDTFLAVLSANIQAAEQAKDAAMETKLKTIFDKVVAALRENAPPAIKFINELMQMPFEQAQAQLDQHAPEFGHELIRWMEMLGNDLASRNNPDAIVKLGRLRDEAIRVLAVAGMNDDSQ